MSRDESRPPLGPPGAPRSEPPVYGEPKGPRPPTFSTVDKPAREMDAQQDGEPPAGGNTGASAPVSGWSSGDDVAIHGFHGGVEHSQEMAAARKRDGKG